MHPHWKSRVAAFACGMAASIACAQLQPMGPLPPSLKGRWTALPPAVPAGSDRFTLRFEGKGAPGPVKGRIDWRGQACGALDAPLTGTWDGSLLRVTFVARPGINTPRAGAKDCGAGKTLLILRRKGVTTEFEGEATLDDGPAIYDLTAAP